MCRMIQLFSLCIIAIFSICAFQPKNEIEETPQALMVQPILFEPQESEEVVIEKIVDESEYLSKADVELIALVTMAEAEGECEEGKRLVIDTILNRVDSKHFPDTVYEVVYQPNQFSAMWNGRLNRCEIRDDICQLVEEELKSRTNSEIVFFMAGRYGQYGVPVIQVENHYFSSYN